MRALRRSAREPSGARVDASVLYSIDYYRGIDILRWKGKHYVPGESDPLGALPGTDGVTPIQPPTAEQAARRDTLAAQLQSTGWSPLVCTLVAQN